MVYNKKLLIFQIFILTLFCVTTSKDNGIYAGHIPPSPTGTADILSSPKIEEKYQNIDTQNFENPKFDEGMFAAIKLAMCYNSTQDTMPRMDQESLLLILPVECNSEKCSNCTREIQPTHQITFNHDEELLTSTLEQVKDPFNFYNYDDDLEIEAVFHCSFYNQTSSSFTAYYRIEATKNGTRLLSPDSPNFMIPEDYEYELPKVFLVEQFLDGEWNSNNVSTSWLISSTVPQSTNLTLRITGIVSNDKIYKPITTPPLNLTINSGRGTARKPTNPRVVRVRQNPGTTNGTDMQVLIHWESGNGQDATCKSSIWVMGQNARTVERNKPWQSFWFQISSQTQTKKIYFNETYRVHLLEKSDEEDDAGTQTTALEFRLPTCTTIFGNNFTLCAPNPPTKIKISEASNNSYIISWGPPEHVDGDGIIEFYELRISKLISYSGKGTLIGSNQQHHLISTNVFNARVPGNSTVYVLSNFTYHGSFELSLRAKSKGGFSSYARVQHHMDGGSSIKLIIGFGAFGFFIFLLIIGIWAKLYYGKRKRDKQRTEKYRSTENLDKEANCTKYMESIPETIPMEKLIEHSRLKLLEILGRGNFGIVRKAMLRRPDGYEIPVAVKTIREEENSDEAICEKDWAEVKVMLDLHHPHIICLVGFTLIQNKSPSLVMEFCNGGNLEKYLEKIKPSEEYYRNRCSSMSKILSGSAWVDPVTVANPEYFTECRKSKNEIDRFIDFGQQIADGMAYLSKNKVVHQDLAARNVLVNTNDMDSRVLLKISDFGFSRDVYLKSVYQKRSDTKLPVRWVALESLLTGEYTTKSDVWSFGITFWEIVTYGGRPYAGIEDVVTYLKLGHRLQKPESCPDDLFNLMLECWHKSPELRPTFKEISIALGQMIRGPGTFEYFKPQDPLSQLENDSVSLETTHAFSRTPITYSNMQTNAEPLDSEGYQIPIKPFVPSVRFIKNSTEYGLLTPTKPEQSSIKISSEGQGMIVVNNEIYQENDISDMDCPKEAESPSQVRLIKNPVARTLTTSNPNYKKMMVSLSNGNDYYRPSEFKNPFPLKMNSNLYSKYPSEPSFVNSLV